MASIHTSAIKGPLSEGSWTNPLFKGSNAAVGAIGHIDIWCDEGWQYPNYIVQGIAHAQLSTNGVDFAAEGASVNLGTITNQPTRLWLKLIRETKAPIYLEFPERGLVAIERTYFADGSATGIATDPGLNNGTLLSVAPANAKICDIKGGGTFGTPVTISIAFSYNGANLSNWQQIGQNVGDTGACLGDQDANWANISGPVSVPSGMNRMHIAVTDENGSYTWYFALAGATIQAGTGTAYVSLQDTYDISDIQGYIAFRRGANNGLPRTGLVCRAVD